MGLFKQILGICNTKRPADENCWKFANGKIEIELKDAPELSKSGGAIRLEGKEIPGRILVFRGDDDNFHALENKCTHIGRRRIDPIIGSDTIKCCSVLGSTYKYSGEVISGPAKKSLKTFQVESVNGNLIVTM